MILISIPPPLRDDVLRRIHKSDRGWLAVVVEVDWTPMNDSIVEAHFHVAPTSIGVLVPVPFPRSHAVWHGHGLVHRRRHCCSAPFVEWLDSHRSPSQLDRKGLVIEKIIH